MIRAGERERLGIMEEARQIRLKYAKRPFIPIVLTPERKPRVFTITNQGMGGGPPVRSLNLKLAKVIIGFVCEAFEVSPDRLMSPDRSRCAAYPRFAAILLMLTHSSPSYPSVGRFFKRDHTTIMHAHERARELYFNDVSWRRMFDRAESLLVTP